MIDYRFATHLTVTESKLSPDGEIAYLKAVYPVAADGGTDQRQLASLHYWDGAPVAPRAGERIVIAVFTQEQWDAALADAPVAAWVSVADEGRPSREVLDSPSA